jgi:hypothetical protein
MMRLSATAASIARESPDDDSDSTDPRAAIVTDSLWPVTLVCRGTEAPASRMGAPPGRGGAEGRSGAALETIFARRRVHEPDADLDAGRVVNLATDKEIRIS